MSIRQSSYLKVIFLLLMIAVTVSCAATKLYKKGSSKKSNIVGAVIQDQETSIEIREEVDENGEIVKKGFSHPYYFTEKGLANILSSVYYKERGWVKGSGRRKLFRVEELQKIVPAIMNAFTMATDSQDILVFTTSHKVLLADRQSYFSLFITEDDLNVVFSVINNRKSINDGRSFRLRDKNKFKDPLTVKKGTTGLLSYWNLVPMGGQRLKEGRKNWLIVDLTSDMYGLSSTADSSSDPIRAGSSTKAIQNRAATNTRFIQEKKMFQNIREKLKELKVLKDEGLISDEDYEMKKKELLNKF